MTVFAGLDVHKKYFHATAVDESGDVLVQGDFPNETEGYEEIEEGEKWLETLEDQR